MDKLADKNIMSVFSAHSYASVVWCFPLHGSVFIKRHPGEELSARLCS